MVTTAATRTVLLLSVVVVMAGCDAEDGSRDTVAATSRSAGPEPRDRTAEPEQRRSESELPGSERWHLRNRAFDRQIEGYTDRVSGPPGVTVGLRVSTSARSFRVLAFRVGAYRGGTGHLVWSSGVLPGRVQPDPVMRPYSTRTVVAPWRDDVRVDTRGWTPGAYVFKLVSRDGWQAAAPYFVTSPSVEGRLVVVAPVATWQAYNRWGGYSLYFGAPGDRRAWRVSFDRPYLAAGLAGFGFALAPIAIAAERSGVQVGYLTDLDLHASTHALDGAAGYVSAGHDEYWTQRMRTTVERARDAGTNLAFLGANTMYWRIRLERSPLGPRRVMVGYRSDAHLDPEVDPRKVTGRFRDAPAPSSEKSLVGMEYECFPVDAAYKVVTPGWWGFDGTGVREGTTFPHLVGNESDRVYPGPATPRPMQVLSDAAYSCRGAATSGQSVYYTAPSGAAVLNVGTLNWTCSLTPDCFGAPVAARTRRFVAQVTANVMREFSQPRAGARNPAEDNVDDFYLPRVNLVPAS